MGANTDLIYFEPFGYLKPCLSGIENALPSAGRVSTFTGAGSREPAFPLSADSGPSSVKLLHLLSGPLFALAAALPAPAQDPPPPTVVALLDTGIDATHPDLAGALLPAINILAPGKPADDPALHGTVLAGLIAGRSANPDIRGWAADFPVRVLPIKVSDGETAKAADLASAIDAALREKASVICLAFTAPSSTAELDAALDRAQQAGQVFEEKK